MNGIRKVLRVKELERIDKKSFIYRPCCKPSSSLTMPTAPASGTVADALESTYVARPRPASMPFVLAAPFVAAATASENDFVEENVFEKGMSASIMVLSPVVAVV